MEDQTNELLERVQDLAQKLADPAGPNYGIITIDNKDFRDELVDVFVRELPDFQHIVLELAPTQVLDIVEILREKMPPEILESPDVKWVIHVINLEVSLYHEIWTGESAFMERLNDAMESLNTEFPFITMIYAGLYLTQRIQNEANALWESFPMREDFSEGELNENTLANRVKKLKEEWDAAQAASDATSYTRILGDFGKIIYVAGRTDWAMDLLDEALAHRETASSPNHTAKALFVKGLCLIVHDESDEGLELIEEAIELYEQEENYQELTSSYQFLGGLYEQSHDNKKARPYYEAALNSARKVDSLHDIIRSSQRLGNIHLSLGNLAKAATCFGISAEAWIREGKPVTAATMFQKQAGTYQDMRQWQDALTHYQKALEIAQEADDEFLIHSLEDSISDMEAKVNSKDKKKRKGLFGKFLG